MEDTSGILIQQLPPGSPELKETTGTVHIDMPNKDDGTFLKVPVLLQVPEGMQTLMGLSLLVIYNNGRAS